MIIKRTEWYDEFSADKIIRVYIFGVLVFKNTKYKNKKPNMWRLFDFD